MARKYTPPSQLRSKSEFKRVSPKEKAALGYKPSAKVFRDLLDPFGRIIPEREYVAVTRGETLEERARKIATGARKLESSAKARFGRIKQAAEAKKARLLITKKLRETGIGVTAAGDVRQTWHVKSFGGLMKRMLWIKRHMEPSATYQIKVLTLDKNGRESAKTTKPRFVEDIDIGTLSDDIREDLDDLQEYEEQMLDEYFITVFRRPIV